MNIKDDLSHYLKYLNIKMDCFACPAKIINNSERLTCYSCQKNCHYLCLGMSENTYESMSEEFKRAWRCPSCANVTLRRKNDNTPVRKSFETMSDNTNMSIDDLLQEDTERSMFGDTIGTQQYQTTNQERETVTIDQISTLLDTKLKANYDKIVSNLTGIIQAQINLGIAKISDDFTQTNNSIISKQQYFEQQLQKTQEKINLLETENYELKKELKDIKNILETKNGTNLQKTDSDTNKRTLVLYGLDEYYRESEEDVITRINYLFQDLLSIDINGYVESVKRTGRKGNRRPLIIELISNRMKKYILNNSHCFKYSGYSVSAILDKEGLERRYYLRECLKTARHEGKHAIMRNNKLYINGKEHCPVSYKQVTQDTLKNTNVHISADALNSESERSAQSLSSEREKNSISTVIEQNSTSGQNPKNSQAAESVCSDLFTDSFRDNNSNSVKNNHTNNLFRNQ
ncbi:uncharacterized protein LOC133520161 [Cydia pomonella]|uniref:uncharacterized protein LOC133520161 n=1 Tax=Cydia pomonella TaxID=82600 RepID=UPI002ADE5E03|nr:uncharacterized protein LOC133520161 [Cydia pomonella]